MNIKELLTDYQKWNLETFLGENAMHPLLKLESEIQEVREALENETDEEVATEIADCIMCLLSCAGRRGIPAQNVLDAFAKKFQKNKTRKWKRNADGTYSHIKDLQWP